jgi:signal transduction histidine kinase
MKLRLRSRFALVMVSVVVVLAGVLSSALHTRFRAFVEESARAEADATARALLAYVEADALARARSLAEILVNAYYRYQIDAIAAVLQSISNNPGIVYVYAYDETGTVIQDGTETFDNFGLKLDDDATHRTLAEGAAISWTEGATLHASAPVLVGSRVLGGVRLGSDLGEANARIAELRRTLDELAKASERKLAVATGVVFLLMAALGILLSLLAANALSRPIRGLARFAGRIADGDYGAAVPFRRSDEIGELALSVEDMARTLARHIDELEKRQRELTKAKEDAEFANREKSHFLANMSHELRTPLNAVIGFAEMLERKTFGPLGDARYEDYAKRIGESGGHLLQLINDVLDVAKIEAGGFVLDEEEVDLAETVDSCVRMVRDRAERGGVRVETAAAALASLPLLLGDQRMVKQIVLNLLSNAVKFTPAGGRVAVAGGFGADGGIVLEVADTGIGIAPEDIPRVTKPFVQLENPLSRKYQGSGLGLALAKSLTEFHGGALAIASEVGRGTTVAVRFPVGRTRARKPERRASA